MPNFTPSKHISRSSIHDERYPVTINCNNCKSSFRAYNIGPVLATHKYKYCIVCASNRISIVIDIDQDYWEVLAKAYKMSPDAIEAIYNTWNTNEHILFSDHVKETRKMLRLLKQLGANNGNDSIE